MNNGLAESLVGTITVVPPSGSLVGEDFLLNNGDWKITGNKKPSPAIFESFSRGLLLNHYIYGTDNEIDIGKCVLLDVLLRGLLSWHVLVVYHA